MFWGENPAWSNHFFRNSTPEFVFCYVLLYIVAIERHLACRWFVNIQDYIHTRRLTWNLRIHPWKRKIIFQTIIFRFYCVNLWGCIPPTWKGIDICCFFVGTSPKKVKFPSFKILDVVSTPSWNFASIAGLHILFPYWDVLLVLSNWVLTPI